jgi:hypothetical protein
MGLASPERSTISPTTGQKRKEIAPPTVMDPPTATALFGAMIATTTGATTTAEPVWKGAQSERVGGTNTHSPQGGGVGGSDVRKLAKCSGVCSWSVWAGVCMACGVVMRGTHATHLGSDLLR